MQNLTLKSSLKLQRISKTLIAGMDEISMTLQYKEDIKNYENQRLKEKPWIAEDPRILK